MEIANCQIRETSRRSPHAMQSTPRNRSRVEREAVDQEVKQYGLENHAECFIEECTPAPQSPFAKLAAG